jgi:hypothetical protein
VEKSLESFCAAPCFLFTDSLAGWFCNLQDWVLFLGGKVESFVQEQVASFECGWGEFVTGVG